MLAAHGFACGAQIGENLRQMADDFAESHVGHVAVVGQRWRGRGFGHEVAAEECEAGLIVECAYGRYQWCGV